MRGSRPVLIVVLAALGLAAPAAARAAPQVVVNPACLEVDYGVSATLSGFPATTSVGLTIDSDSFSGGPFFFETDSAGGFTSGAVGGPPFGFVTVHAFADVNGNQTEDPGEPAATGTVDKPCEGLPLPGGTVSGTADGSSGGSSVHLDLDAHGNPGGAGGTVVDRRNGVDYHGEVTCVGLRRVSASIGVR